MPFNMFGEDQSSWMPDNSAIGAFGGGFSMPQIDPYQQMAAQMVVEKKKKGWLDEMAERLAGDRYYGTNEVDRKRATAQAMIDLGKQFNEAAKKGSWGAFASTVGGALPTMTGSFDREMGVAQGQRETNRNQEYADKKRAIDLEASQVGLASNRITLGNQQENEEVERRTEESMPSTIGMLDDQFNKVIKKTDISDGRRTSALAEYQALATAAANDPSNPQLIANVANFISKLAEDSDLSEDTNKRFNVALELEAKKNGFNSTEEYVKHNNLRLRREITQQNLGIELTQSSIAENKAQRDKALADAAYVDGGVPKSHKTSYEAVKQTLNNLERDDEFFSTIESIMGRENVELGPAMRARLKMYGINPGNPASAREFLENFMPANRDAYIKKLIGLGEVDPSMTGGVGFDMNDPVAINNFLNGLSPEERAFFKGPQ